MDLELGVKVPIPTWANIGQEQANSPSSKAGFFIWGVCNKTVRINAGLYPTVYLCYDIKFTFTIVKK